MNSALTSRLPFKMFHCVRDVNLGSINSSFFERLIHDFSGRSNKGLTGDIFIIPWLFADEHDRCAFRALAKNGLRRALEKVTCLTIFRRLTDGRPAHGVGRSRRSCKVFILLRHLYYESKRMPASGVAVAAALQDGTK